MKPRRNWKQWLCKVWGVNQVNYGLCENGQSLHWWVEVLHVASFHVTSSNLRLKNLMSSKFLISLGLKALRQQNFNKFSVRKGFCLEIEHTLRDPASKWRLREKWLRLRANGRNNPQQCWELLANSVASVCTGLKLWPVSNFAQQHPTTCNRVCKRTQHVTSNNVGSCWPTMLPPFARGFTFWDQSIYSLNCPSLC